VGTGDGAGVGKKVGKNVHVGANVSVGANVNVGAPQLLPTTTVAMTRARRIRDGAVTPALRVIVDECTPTDG